MKLLFHYWMSPYCRKVRAVLAEKNLDFSLKLVKPWVKDDSLIRINPAGTTPVLIDNGNTIIGNLAVTEYLEEAYTDKKLITGNKFEKAEIRRLVEWFDNKFYNEVYKNLVVEKIDKRLSATGAPDSNALRAGLANIEIHLSYIDYLMDRRRYLAGNELSLADLTAAAHLSTIDYLGDISWDNHRQAKEWYARIKSRPCFREILCDYITQIPPSKHYADLDF